MKTVLKLCLVMAVLTGALFAQSHVYRQVVRSVPDTTGYVWYTWDIFKVTTPTDYLDKNSPGSGCLFSSAGQFMRWFADAGNFQHPWVDGDLCCILGSWQDSAAFNHEGYYWLYSDEQDATVDPQTWSPDDTMRVMENAVVSATFRANLDVEIPNPYETNHVPWGSLAYDVLGFWVVADTTATGTPDAYDVDLGFAPLNGGAGAVTTFSYDTDVMFYSGFAKSTYHSYYIVARPETTVTPGVIPGFSTAYMAANSNLYTFGVEEFDDAEQVGFSLDAAPNPFTQNATISYSLAQSSQVRLTMYNGAGQVLATLVNETKPAGKYSIDYDGGALPSGVYFYRLETSERNVTKTFVKVN